MDVELLSCIFLVLEANMASMRLLVKGGKVCHAWKHMAVAMRDKTDGMSLTARYNIHLMDAFRMERFVSRRRPCARC